jgi:hypothetical protein
MKHIDLKAFHDTRASPVATMELSHESSIPEFLPKLAEEAGLGAFLENKPYSGVFTYENGVITATKVTDRDCTL